MNRYKVVAAVVLAVVIFGAVGPGILADGVEYVVQPGDTLYRIALRYGTTVSALATANGIANPNRIYSGQRLVIPGAAQPAAAPASPPPAAPASAPAAAVGTVYTVRPGDTLYRIALRYGTTVSALVAANGIANPNRIYVGQQIRIAGGTAAPAPAPSGANPAPSQPVVTGRGVTLTVDSVSYQPGRADLMVTVRNNGLLPAVASGNWYPTPNEDGGRQWVTLLKAAHLEVPVPMRGDAPLWEFIVTTNDGLRFSALAGCRYLEVVFAEGIEPTAQGGFYWSTSLEGGWFDCGNAYQVKPPADLLPGQSATVPLHVYLVHPRNDPNQAPGRRIARLDFIPYAPTGASFGVQASYSF
ncbi:MAG: LysM peptidoglycan-binding domain-containing protein [Anaerolineae bacterium]|nr:LysM peptidoglycan-binding domain-containing protein [Anaerolineae bacterium]